MNRIAASASSLRSVTEQPIETRECSHPYSPNMDTRETISFEGATSMVVEFDPQCRTESSCDWLKLFAGMLTSCSVFAHVLLPVCACAVACACVLMSCCLCAHELLPVCS